MSYDQHPTDLRHGGKMTVEQMAGRIAELEADKVELVDALRELCDRQNGPPLVRDAAAWEAAMARAYAVLAKHERE